MDTITLKFIVYNAGPGCALPLVGSTMGSMANAASPSQPGALYPEIARRLRSRISMMPPNVPLPSERNLAREYGTTRDTLRRALAVLEREGLVRTFPNRGVFTVSRSQ